MTELYYLVLGWLLGLLGPRIIDSIKAYYDRKQLKAAIASEATHLQSRLATTSYLLAQTYGDMSKAYLTWLRPHLGGATSPGRVATIQVVETLLTCDDDTYRTMVDHLRAEPGSGLSMKTYSTSFLDSSMSALQQFPFEYQLAVHEFKNSLSTLNQEI